MKITVEQKEKEKALLLLGLCDIRQEVQVLGQVFAVPKNLDLKCLQYLEHQNLHC